MYLEAMADYLAKAKGIYIVDEQQKALIPWLSLDPGNKPAAGGGSSK
jgi:membrane protease subunit HflK